MTINRCCSVSWQHGEPSFVAALQLRFADVMKPLVSLGLVW